LSVTICKEYDSALIKLIEHIPTYKIFAKTGDQVDGCAI